MADREDERSIAKAFEYLALLPPPWRLVDQTIIEKPIRGLGECCWTFRAKMGKGVLGGFALASRVATSDRIFDDKDVVYLEWNRADEPVALLVDALPSFLESFRPYSLVLKRGMDSPHFEWTNYAISNYPDSGLYYDFIRNVCVIGIANYWNADLCQSSFGKTPQEVVEALKGVALDLRIIRDGVYVVFANNFGAEDDILELNRKVRPLLGGYGLFRPPPWYQPEV